MSARAIGAGGRGRLLRVPAVVLLAAMTVVACSAGGSDGGTDGGGKASATSTTGTTLSFEENDALVRLNIAMTGMNLVASDIGLRTLRGPAVDYCRSQAPAELEPHRAELVAAADASVRQHAEVALGELAKAIELCANGADSSAVRDALDSYNARFQRLRDQIEAGRRGGR